jgi:hypothetical protein
MPTLDEEIRRLEASARASNRKFWTRMLMVLGLVVALGVAEALGVPKLTESHLILLIVALILVMVWYAVESGSKRLDAIDEALARLKRDQLEERADGYVTDGELDLEE